MKEKIVSQLKALYPGVNLSQARMDAIADKLSGKITDEAQIDAELQFLNEVQPFKDIAAFDDYQRSKAARDRQQQQQQSQQNQQNNQQNSQQQQSNGSQQNDDATALLRSIADRLGKIEAKERTAAMQQRLSSHDKLKTVPQSFYRGRPIPEKEDELDSFAESVAADYSAFQQETATTALTGGQPPVNGIPNGSTAAVDSAIDKWAGSDKK